MTDFKIPEPDLQVTFYQRLTEIRGICLLDALLTTVAGLQISRIDQELANLAAPAALGKIAGWGLRGELIFPVPSVLTSNPCLLGYYRLLLGFSQKQFYGNRYGFTPFKAMETKGQLSDQNKQHIEQLCRTLCTSAHSFVDAVEYLSKEAMHELTLLTLGAQLRGSALNMMGSRATRKIFDLIRTHLSNETVAEGERTLEVENAAGRFVRVEFAADPDICIREQLPSGTYHNLVAIEIKGGQDYSNIHNRIGEAEKSHQKARHEGYVECWTLVGVEQINMESAKNESPTTDRFFYIDRVTDPSSPEADEFRENLISRLGIRA